ncbi:MAG TPA: hypothetical protein VHB97_19230 [Polyangia bacterium]|nr:hypothetical protein [Polyangia bacterium]
MKRAVVASVAVFALLGFTAPAHAKKKKKAATSASVQKPYDAKSMPPVNDKRTNEGAQGRINATEDAAQQADSPQFDHRP